MSFRFFELPERFISATLDGMVFGREDSDALLKLERFDGWFGTPGVRADKTDRLWGHGSFTERGLRDSRLIIAEGNARFSSEQAAVDAYYRLTSMIADGTFAQMSVVDSLFGLQTADVRLANELSIEWLTSSIFKYQVQLFAADPRKYGQALTASTGVSIDGGGLDYPLYSPGGALSYGPAGTPGTLQLTNVGTADTPVVHTLTGDMPYGFTITELGTQRRLVYAGAVIPGQVIRLDSADGSVMLDGDNDRGSELVRRDWVRLGKGQTGTWLFEAPGSTGALLSTEVVPAWW
ncbi:hypothetical protein [Arthrobacter cryoconiti]|uniref:Minor tail protein n=1 Tax=Arthrobacter cryoconiti TaxID=748907 RepID=A0ABV8QWB6_9MICC|nr:hypothetical protein [Arthrobacter cryoconiti]MCC9068792.1 hypothetical protein [Arthrobacter cryoconiti]